MVRSSSSRLQEQSLIEKIQLSRRRVGDLVRGERCSFLKARCVRDSSLLFYVRSFRWTMKRMRICTGKRVPPKKISADHDESFANHCRTFSGSLPCALPPLTSLRLPLIAASTKSARRESKAVRYSAARSGICCATLQRLQLQAVPLQAHSLERYFR